MDASKAAKRQLSDDRALVEQTLAGKTQSFEALVRRYQDRLYNTLVHITGSTHEAEEVAQEAMLQAYAKLATFKGNSSFYTWLYRIAFNLWVSRNRRRRPRVSLNQIQEATGIDPPDETESPSANLERRERAQQLQDALARLSEEFRQILILREMEDCDYDAISDILQIPVGTVRSRLHRARSALRDQLRSQLGDLRQA